VGAPELGEPAHRPQAGSRARVESRLAFPGADEDAEEIATPTRRFSVHEITSGLPDDSRGAGARVAERQFCETRARVKEARAVVAGTPGVAGSLKGDWQRAAMFYARFGITEVMFLRGVPTQAP
jgi:hypothetical protein